MARPIVLATDYGVAGSYVGQLKSAIYTIVPEAPVIDLIHDLPACNSRASAYLLVSYLKYVPRDAIVVAVVDPGVGTACAPIVLESAYCTLVGPDNGLFAITAKKLLQCSASKILLSEPPASNTFHGRDVFALTAARMAAGSAKIASVPILKEELVGMDWPLDLSEIIYFDHFGNAVSGITLEQVDKTCMVKIKGHELCYAATFSDVDLGELFWYRNANGLLEIAAREASARQRCLLSIGDKIDFPIILDDRLDKDF